MVPTPAAPPTGAQRFGPCRHSQDATQPYLPDDHTTVSYEIAIRHRRPTPVGETFTATAELLEVEGRRLLFRVEARNAREVIGEGTIRRTIVRKGALG